MSADSVFNETSESQNEGAASRRSFLKRASLASAATAALTAGGFLSASNTAEAARTGNRDIAILNFALMLEYLEAEFYLYAFKGTGLEAEGVAVTGSGGAPGAVTVKDNPRVDFQSAVVAAYAREIAEDEKNHVIALRATIEQLGGVPASRPPINLRDSFNTLAQAAGIGSSFDPFANDINFLLGAFIFEDVGVTAYKGASPLVANKNVLEAAAGILAVEASHSGIIRTALFNASPTATMEIAQNVQKISDLRDTLDGAGDLDQPLFDANGNANLVVTDSLGIAFSRTPRQVLNIVFGAQNVTQGLFFPQGVRGQITQ
jgi:hypothetical protein